MKVFKIRLILFLFFLIGYNIFCEGQFKSKIQMVINDINYKNGNLIIKYEIVNASNNDNIRVWIDVFNSKKDTIYAKSWKGDVNKKVEGGGEKVAIWNVFNDNLNLTDSINIKISATIENRFYLDDPLILSTIYPGWGDYKINSQGPYWLYGAIGYSLVGASIGMFYFSTDNYNKYLNSKLPVERNNYYNNSIKGKALTYSLIGAAGMVWAIDYIRVIKRKNEIKKIWKKSSPVKENPSIPSLKITSALSKKEFINTNLTNLQLVQGSIRYIDVDENMCLDAFESGFIEFKLINNGPARAVNFYAKVDATELKNYISIADSFLIGNIGVNQEKVIRIPLQASGDLVSGSYKMNINVSAYQNNPVPQFSLTINTSSFKYIKDISFNEFSSDIDKDIPFIPASGKEKFALIIGNEGYANKYTGLSKNFNVPYARHDALTFKKYAINILGIKESNIFLLLDGTKKEMYENILMLSDKVSKIKDGAELVFYYAGQGLSDTNSMAPYLMPIDIPPSKMNEAISLDFLFKKIWESRSTKSVVVMDASFNNGGRNLGMRGPSIKKVNPRREVISGNTVVFNAVSESYTANSYDEMKHGLFTYYFLKVLKDSRGNIDFMRLDNSVKANVTLKAISIGKEQVPIALVSIAVSDIWQNWSIR